MCSASVRERWQLDAHAGSLARSRAAAPGAGPGAGRGAGARRGARDEAGDSLGGWRLWGGEILQHFIDGFIACMLTLREYLKLEALGW